MNFLPKKSDSDIVKKFSGVGGLDKPKKFKSKNTSVSTVKGVSVGAPIAYIEV